jgi:hypothetical protein
MFQLLPHESETSLTAKPTDITVSPHLDEIVKIIHTEY